MSDYAMTEISSRGMIAPGRAHYSPPVMKSTLPLKRSLTKTDIVDGCGKGWIDAKMLERYGKDFSSTAMRSSLI